MANEKTINSRIQNKVDTEVNWTTAGQNGFIPKNGEFIIYKEDSNGSTTNPSGHTVKRYKIGDGVTKVHELPFISDQSVNMLAEESLVVITPYTSQLAGIGFDATNKVITPATALVGAALKGGCKCFEVTGVSVTANSYNATLTLDSVAGIVVSKDEDKLYSFSQHISAGWTEANCVDSLIVTSIDTTNKKVSVSASNKFKNWLTINHSGSEYTKFKDMIESLKERDLTDLIPATRARLYRAFWCLDLPEIGTRPLSGGTMAVGAQNEALGQGSFANGKVSRAGGQFSFATGNKTQALSNAAFSEGDNTVAEGEYSHAMGGYTHARGSNSLAGGMRTAANGENSAALGIDTEANGYHAMAVGNTTKANGNQSLATGNQTQAKGHCSFTSGQGSVATGYGAAAFGSTTQANGDYSISAGLDSIANGARSIAAGVGSKTSKFREGTTDQLSYHAIAVGNGTEANYDEAVALGDHSKALHKASVAEGNRTITGANFQHVMGTYNEVRSDCALIIGNGTSDNDRKNAFGVTKNGSMFLNGPISFDKKGGSIKLDNYDSEYYAQRLAEIDFSSEGYLTLRSTFGITPYYKSIIDLSGSNIELKTSDGNDSVFGNVNITTGYFRAEGGTNNYCSAVQADNNGLYLYHYNPNSACSASINLSNDNITLDSYNTISIGSENTQDIILSKNPYIGSESDSNKVLKKSEINSLLSSKVSLLPSSRPSYCVYAHMGSTAGVSGLKIEAALPAEYTLPLRGAGGVIFTGTPTQGNHAATKAYVDNAIANAGGGSGASPSNIINPLAEIINLENTSASPIISFTDENGDLLPGDIWFAQITPSTEYWQIDVNGNIINKANTDGYMGAITIGLYPLADNGSHLIVVSYGNTSLSYNAYPATGGVYAYLGMTGAYNCTYTGYTISKA